MYDNYCRCGFVNESAPRVILKSETRQAQPLLSISDVDHLFRHLCEFIESLYFRYLAVNPRDRKVIIVESVFCPTKFRLTLAKVLFTHFDVPALVLLPAHLMALNTLIASTALVVDMGFTETSVTPVIEGVTVLDAVHFQDLGAKAIHNRIRQELLSSKAPISRSGQDFLFDKIAIDNLSETTIEDIKVRTCFVAPYVRGQELSGAKAQSQSMSSGSPPDVQYPLLGHAVLTIPGLVRESAYQVLFELVGNESTIATMILDAISWCPTDSRRTLASNIVLTGGTAIAPGLKKRLSDELHQLVETSPLYKEKIKFKDFKFFHLPCPPNYASWLGAAIYGSTDAVLNKAITGKEFEQSRGILLTDWSNWWPTPRPARIDY